MTVMALKKNNMERKSKNGGFKLKGHALPGIKQIASTKMADGRAKSSAFQKDKDFPGLVDFEVEVKGGKKTKQGEFMQDRRGSTITGSSVRHDELRTKKRKTKTNPNAPKLTPEEKAELRTLNMKTEKAYKKIKK